MTKLEQLKEIIQIGKQGNVKSKLTSEAIDTVGGFTSPNIRNLMNLLGGVSSTYLECGSHIGSTLISTVFGNDNLESAIGIDNFSLFDEGMNAKKDFLSHCNRLIPNRYKLLEQDYFTVTKEKINKPIDLYLFDGSHDYESQKKGITYYAPLLADESIIVVDDYDWEEPFNGTNDGIIESGLNVVFSHHFTSNRSSDCGVHGWWNGLFVALIKK